MAVRVRPATPADIDLLRGLILDLAAFHNGAEQVTGTSAMLAEALFGDVRYAEALIAEIDDEPAGFALFHGNFSTYECRPCLWLEDLYVSERSRGAGAGHALLAELARLAVARGCARVEWHRAEWNETALRFYEGLGAELRPEDRLHRLSGAALRELARSD
jgi:GNAT superfamily N-acetyltransferase